MRAALLPFLLLAACAPPAESAAPDRPVLALFAAPGLPLGDELRRAVLDEPRLRALAEVVELDVERDAALFASAMGTGGRLGLVWLDGEGQVLSTLPGFASAAEVVERSELVRGRLVRWGASTGDLGRARIQVELRAFAPAEARLRAALDRVDLPALRERLARCLVRRGAVAEARAALGRALELDPTWSDHPGLLLTRALAHIAAREPQAAIEVLERVSTLAPDGPETDQVLLALATALHHAGRVDGLEQLRLLLERYPLSPWRADARRQIEHVLSPPAEHSHR